MLLSPLRQPRPRPAVPVWPSKRCTFPCLSGEAPGTRVLSSPTVLCMGVTVCGAGIPVASHPANPHTPMPLSWAPPRLTWCGRARCCSGSSACCGTADPRRWSRLQREQRGRRRQCSRPRAETHKAPCPTVRGAAPHSQEPSVEKEVKDTRAEFVRTKTAATQQHDSGSLLHPLSQLQTHGG